MASSRDGPPPFRHCMVFAGGGTRFAYFLGMHAAACEAGHPPDLLLATCGGALAAATLRQLPDPVRAKGWMAGSSMFEFIRSLQPVRGLNWPRMLADAARRWTAGSMAPRLPDVWGQHLFTLGVPVPLPSGDKTSADRAPSIALIGARALYSREEAGGPRAGRPLFEQTVFTSRQVVPHIAGRTAAMARRLDTLVPTLASRSDLPLADAVRISITDLHYLSAHELPREGGGRDSFVGGFVDLCPIELARSLAATVTVEIKSGFDSLLAGPALRYGLGLDAARRRDDVLGQPAHWWVDTTDMRQATPTLLGWRLGLRGIQVVAPPTIDAFASYVSQQWDYGFARGREAFSRPGAGNPGPAPASRRGPTTRPVCKNCI